MREGMRITRGDFVLGLLAAAPAAAGLWLQRGEGLPALELLGLAAGVLGLSFLLLAAAISVRIPGFDLWFGGLTRLWKIHHVLGAAAFLLLMAHPLLLSFAAAGTSLVSASAWPTASFTAAIMAASPCSPAIAGGLTSRIGSPR